VSETQSNRRRRRQAESGFSLVEVMIVTGIAGVITAIAVLTISSTRQALIGDGAMRVVLAQMNQAKELAITQRRYMDVTFTGGNSVQILREEIPLPVSGLPTVVSSIPFEGGLTFQRISGVPDLNVVGNTPVTNELVSVPSPNLVPTPPHTDAVAFGDKTTQVRFAPDGTFVDQDGIAANGTLFVALTNLKLSSRAVAIFGSTGRIRAYRWDGRNWKPV
jgi:prepilin-type N-terminal cleavage/methylation domain-containing protein